MSKITGRDKRVADWLEKIGIDPKITRRVVIDIPYDGAVVMYVERFGDSSMFEIEPPPDLRIAMKVRTEDDIEEVERLTRELEEGWPIFPDPIDPPPYEPSFEELKRVQAIQRWEHPDD